MDQAAHDLDVFTKSYDNFIGGCQAVKVTCKYCQSWRILGAQALKKISGHAMSFHRRLIFHDLRGFKLILFWILGIGNLKLIQIRHITLQQYGELTTNKDDHTQTTDVQSDLGTVSLVSL